MKHLNTGNVTAGIGMPVKSGALTHIQSAFLEGFDSVCRALIGGQLNASTGFILHGCKNTGSGSNYIISAGAVYFNGEIYQCDGVSFTLGVGESAVGIPTLTQWYATNADPVMFTDGSNYNVHDILKVVWQGVVSIPLGSFSYDNSVDLAYMPQGCIGQTISWRMPSGGVLSSFFDGTGLGLSLIHI